MKAMRKKCIQIKVLVSEGIITIVVNTEGPIQANFRANRAEKLMHEN